MLFPNREMIVGFWEYDRPNVEKDIFGKHFCLPELGAVRCCPARPNVRAFIEPGQAFSTSRDEKGSARATDLTDYEATIRLPCDPGRRYGGHGDEMPGSRMDPAELPVQNVGAVSESGDAESGTRCPSYVSATLKVGRSTSHERQRRQDDFVTSPEQNFEPIRLHDAVLRVVARIVPLDGEMMPGRRQCQWVMA